MKIEITKRLANDFIVDIYSPKISGISIDAIGKIEIIEAVPKLQFWNSNLRFKGKSGL